MYSEHLQFKALEIKETKASLGAKRRTGQGGDLLQHRLIQESRWGSTNTNYVPNVHGFLPLSHSLVHFYIESPLCAKNTE